MLSSCLRSPESVADYRPVFSKDTTTTVRLTFGYPNLTGRDNLDLLIKYLNRNLVGARLRMVACLSFDDYLDKLHKRAFDITTTNGLESLKAERNGYHIVGKLGNDEQYYSVILTRKDAGINNITDLRDKSISIAGSDRVPGVMMGLYYLQTHGLDVRKDIVQVPTPSFESSIMNTYLRKTSVGIILYRPWTVWVKKHPDMAAQLKVNWTTPPLINNAVIIKNSVDHNIEQALCNLLFRIHETDSGKKAMAQFANTRFERANHNTYLPMEAFQRKYESAVR